jgi:hypothetical protein
MNSLKRKTIWLDKRGPDDEGNTFVFQSESTVEIPTTGFSQGVPTCSIEIASPGEDDLGRSCKRKRKFVVNAGLISDVKNAASEMERNNRLEFPPRHGDVQIRYEGASGFVVMYEVPAFPSPEKQQGRYVIGDGADIRFILGQLSDLQALARKLETLSK